MTGDGICLEYTENIWGIFKSLKFKRLKLLNNVVSDDNIFRCWMPRPEGLLVFQAFA